MSIVVQKVVGGKAGAWKVEVTFGEQPLIVTMATDNVRDLIGKLSFVELSIDEIISCSKVRELSGITVLESGNHRIVGEIESDMDLGEGTTLYDLLIDVGPNYLALDSHMLEGIARVAVGDRVALEVKGLLFSPTNV